MAKIFKPRKRIVTRKLTTKKEAYRLWFEYLKLALILIDPSFKTKDKKLLEFIVEINTAYSKRKDFYKDWHVNKDTNFNTWWEKHSFLFEEKSNVRQILPGHTLSSSNSILVEIPLNRSATEISKRVMDIVIDAQALAGLRTNNKTKIVGSASFQVSNGSEPKVKILNDMLIVFRDVYKKNPKLKGTKLVEAIYTFYGKRKKGFTSVPKNLIEDDDIKRNTPHDKTIPETIKRTANRYVNNAAQVLINVAGGEFPGKYGSNKDQ